MYAVGKITHTVLAVSEANTLGLEHRNIAQSFTLIYKDGRPEGKQTTLYVFLGATRREAMLWVTQTLNSLPTAMCTLMARLLQDQPCQDVLRNPSQLVRDSLKILQAFLVGCGFIQWRQMASLTNGITL